MKIFLLLFLLLFSFNSFANGNDTIPDWNPKIDPKPSIEVSTAEFKMKILESITISDGDKEIKIDSGQIVKFKVNNKDLVEITINDTTIMEESIIKTGGERSFNIKTKDLKKKLTIKLSGSLLKTLKSDQKSDSNQEDKVLKGVKLFSNDVLLNDFKIIESDLSKAKQNYYEKKSSKEKKQAKKEIKKLEKAKDQKIKDQQESLNNYYCSKMNNCNAILILDGASFVSGQSKLYRKKSNGNCSVDNCLFGCRQTLKVGDYLKVYIENFNAELYDIEFISDQMDYKYGQNYPFLTELPSENGVEAEAANNENDSLKINIIKKYSVTSYKLRQFLTLMRNNKSPDSKLLNENKIKIYYNVIDSLKLDPNIDIDSLYKLLSPEEQKKPENKLYLSNARQFGVTFYEVMNLSYTFEITGLPIQIKSYDQLSLTIRLKDKKSGKLIREQEYIYLIRGGLKIDQSFGIALHNVKDTNFTLKDSTRKDITYAMLSNGVIIEDSIASIKDVATRLIEKGDTTNYKNIGLTTLTHFYYRFTGAVTVGPEIGVSVDFYPTTNIRYLLGLGLLLMDGRNRICLDAGYAFGKYLDLGSGNKFGNTIDGTNTSPSTVEKFGRSWYFGISYNIPISKVNTQKEER